MPQQQDVDVEGHIIGTLSQGNKRFGHPWLLGRRPHLFRDALVEGSISVADRPRFKVTDPECVDIGIQYRFFGKRISGGIRVGLGGNERGWHTQRGNSSTETADKPATGMVVLFFFHEE